MKVWVYIKKMKSRNSAFELLRIITMLFIVFGHALIALDKNNIKPLCTIDNITWLAFAFTSCAVNVYFLISGYFLECGGFKLKKIFFLWFEMFFWSVGIYLVLCLAGMIGFECKAFIGFCFPFLLKKYWFIQCYIVMYFLFPFLKKITENIKQKQHFILCILLLAFFSVYPTFIPVSYTLDQSQGYGIIWGLTLTLVGSYISQYGIGCLERKTMFCVLMYLGCSILIYISNLLIVRLDIAGGLLSRSNFYSYNSISMFLESLAIFYAFKNISTKGFSSRLVNFVGRNNLYVYLISAHPLLIYSIWNRVFDKIEMNNFIVLYILFFTMALFLICIFAGSLLSGYRKMLIFEKLGAKLDEMQSKYL